MFILRTVVLFFRGLWIGLVITWAFLTYGCRRLFSWKMTPERKERLRGETLARTLQRLGATFIKFGQIMSTRPDILGPGFIEPLSKLQDQVPPVSTRAIMAVLQAELSPEARARFSHISPTPIAAASVAQVHRATLDTGEVVALKIQRPGVHRLIHGDLSILGFWARVLNVLPSMKPLSMPGAIEKFGVALRGQLDFQEEARNNLRFATMFDDMPGLDVPGLFPELCTRRVLAMTFVEGVKGSEPDKVGGDRAKLARLGADAILRMVFVDGFVHADLHPGNIILTPDGRVVFIDLGMVAEIDRELMRPWISTFLALGQQNAAEVARLLYVYAPTVGNFPYAEYEAACAGHLAPFFGKPLGEVEISEIVGGVMNVLRKYRVVADPSFTVVHIALLVAEGLGKQLDPSLDLVQLAVPVLIKAAACAPPGIAVRREIPPRIATTSD